jgi:hypothetical protein
MFTSGSLHGICPNLKTSDFSLDCDQEIFLGKKKKIAGQEPSDWSRNKDNVSLSNFLNLYQTFLRKDSLGLLI